ncbi:MAG: hypothetical protein EXR21_09980 [Flavobacteriaceae bacterium]|nr:hypothetical protein [Flavobacteriaceae bacterium]
MKLLKKLSPLAIIAAIMYFGVWGSRQEGEMENDVVYYSIQVFLTAIAVIYAFIVFSKPKPNQL